MECKSHLLPLPVLAPPVVRGRFKFTNYTAEFIEVEKENARRSQIKSDCAIVSEDSLEESRPFAKISHVTYTPEGESLGSPVVILCSEVKSNIYNEMFSEVDNFDVAYQVSKSSESFFGNAGTALDEDFFFRMEIDKYCIAPKIDGIRSIVSMVGNFAHVRARNGDAMKFLMNDNSLNGTVLDCECLLFEDTPMLIILDVYSLGKNSAIYKREQWDRLCHLRHHSFLSPFFRFEIQKFASYSMLESCLDKCPYPTDGIVFTRIDGEYVPKLVDPTLKFWKPPDKITVDLKVLRDPDSDYYLAYTKGKDGYDVICDDDGDAVRMNSCSEGIFECAFRDDGLVITRERKDKREPNTTFVYEKIHIIARSKFTLDFLLSYWRTRAKNKAKKKNREVRVKAPPIASMLPFKQEFYLCRAMRIVEDRRRQNMEFLVALKKKPRECVVLKT